MNNIDLKSVENYADKKLDPVDVIFTKHFADRIKDRNIKQSDLINFFNKLSRIDLKKKFISFIKNVTPDNFTATEKEKDINVPFDAINKNKIAAITVMKKKNFKPKDKDVFKF